MNFILDGLFINRFTEILIKPLLPHPFLNIKIKKRKVRLICEELALAPGLIMRVSGGLMGWIRWRVLLEDFHLMCILTITH